MRLLTLLFFVSPFFLFSQDLTGPQLLEKSIEYHDPKGAWSEFKGSLELTETRPDGPDRKTTLLLDNQRGFFRLDQVRDGETIMRVVENGECYHAVKGSTELTKEQVEKHRLTCERTQLLRNYYTYLWGLPMKLTDAGTVVDNRVQSIDFQGVNCLSLKVTYDEEVGTDTWYFYFSPETFALIGYRFYHDESKNDGEYIVLKGMVKVGEMLLPQRREWYVNDSDKFLGADILSPK